MEPTQAAFELRVLGPASLKDARGRTPQGLGWGKPLALLCLLAVRHEVRRDEAVDLLWRDVDEDKARNAFRQALHRLRSVLGPSLLPQDREILRLVPSADLDVDLDRMRAYESAGQLDDAIEVYGDDFLQGATLGEPAFDLWAEQERVRLRSTFRSVLERAIALASARGDWARASGHARRMVTSAPYDGDAARIAAATLVSAGQGREARELLERFASRLEGELGIAPDAEVKALLARLQRQPRDASSALETVATLPFTGREPQLARLLSLWRAVGEDAGALVVIEGIDGVGRTRLVHELAVHARALRAATVLHATERAHPVPLGLFADALRPLAGASGVAGASPHLLAEAARLLPQLRDSLELPQVSDVGDEAARLRFFEGLAALVDAAAYERPILLVLEDLHHVAPSSLDLLSYLAARLAGAPVMFALTTRPDGPALPRLRALSGADGPTPPHGDRAVRVELTPLGPADIEAAMADTAQRMKFSRRMRDRIVQASEGVPGQLVALLKQAAAGKLVGPQPIAFRDLVAQRVEALPTTHRRLLVVAALIGRRLDAATLAGAAHLSSSAARDVIADLDALGLIALDDAGSVTCMPEAAAAAIGFADSDARAFLSRWIAEALAAQVDASSAEVAHFWAAAGVGPQAFSHYRRAAFDALALGAAAEGAAYLSFAKRFAATDAERSEIERLLAAFGSGTYRLASVSGASGEPNETPAPPAPQAAEPSRWVRLFPHWRVLLGAAIATLLVSTLVLWNTGGRVAVGRSAPDTLVLGEGEPPRAVSLVTGSLASGFATASEMDSPRSNPPWLDSLARPWSAAIPNPRATSVALVRASGAGVDVCVLSADRRDTLVLVRGLADARPLGWSPDGRWVLVSTARASRAGVFDSDLYAFSVARPGQGVAIDTTARRSIVEAEWSPDGSHVAWVARVGENRQLEVFVERADGSGQINVSRNPADDYHIAWSDEGDLLAFTSLRDGNPELYAFSLSEGKTWRLTRDPAQDDRARFSWGGRLVAFESTRGGAPGVYVMPGLGGAAIRVPARAGASLLGWRNGPRRYVDAVRVVGPANPGPGDTAVLRVAAFDQLGDSILSRAIELSIPAPAAATLIPPLDPTAPWKLVGSHDGLVEIVASVPGWRVDTADIRVGGAPASLLQGSIASGFSDWRALGEPAPQATANGIVLNSDAEWDSGILSRRAVPLLPGLEVSAVLSANPPVWEKTSTFGLSLVAPELASTVDFVTPQFLKYASVTWNAEARRFVYVVGREVFSEEVPRPPRDIEIALVVEQDSTLSAYVGGTRRWRSTLRIIDGRNAPRVQVWVASHATGSDLAVREARAELVAGSPRLR